MAAEKIPLADQISELEREATLRRRVYPHMIAAGKVDQDDADRQEARLAAALTTLRWLRDNEDAIRAAVRRA